MNCDNKNMNFEKNIFHPNFHKSGNDNLIQENNRLNIALYIFFFFFNLSRAAILKFVTSFGHLGINVLPLYSLRRGRDYIGIGELSALLNYL